LKPLTAGVADGDVRKQVIVIVSYQRACEEFPKGMIWDGSKDIITESALPTVRCPRRVVQKRSQIFSAALKVC
jgi:hypothetical protein